MAEMTTGEVIQQCLHQVTATIDTLHPEGPATGKPFAARVRNVKCIKCGEELVIGDRNGNPVEDTGFMVMSKATAAAAVKASVPPKKPQPDPSLARSKITRDGLKKGAVAPEFKLPLADGSAEVALSDYRGQRLVLVFVAPNCGPCDAVAPVLQEAHERGVKVLAISRKDAEATKAKADKMGLTFPIVMQKVWEISRLYGMFATPMVYVIGPDGVLETDVVLGSEEIPALIKTLE
jgi:peroxiredoxin